MGIYLINLFSLFAWYFLYKKNEGKKNIKLLTLIGIMVQLVLIQGLRAYSVGSDTQNYINFYVQYTNPNLNDIIFSNTYPGLEKGYVLLMAICRLIGLSDRIFLFLISIIITGLFFRFIYKESSNLFLSIWLYICLEFFTLSFTAFRQMIAMGLILNAFLFVKEKNFRKYLIMCILAFFIHKTSIVFFPMYFINNNQFIKKSNLVMTAYRNIARYKNVIFILLIVSSYIFLPKMVYWFAKFFYPYYLSDSGIFLSSSMTLFYVMLGLFLFSLIIEKKYNVNNKNFFLYQFILVCAICIQTMTSQIQLVGRVALYFYVFVIVFIPLMISYISEKKLRVTITSIFLLATFIQYFFFSMDMYHLVPYTSLFS